MTDSGYHPSHRVPAMGLPAWTNPDPNVAATARLDPGLDVMVLQQWNGWTQVRCSNGWECWIDGSTLQPVSAVPPPPGYGTAATPEQPAPYQQPTYEQPAYQQPAYQQPTYQQPTYQQPTYQQPTYQEPAYQQPGTAWPANQPGTPAGGTVNSYAQLYQYAHPTGRTPDAVVASGARPPGLNRAGLAGAAIGGLLIAVGALLPWVGNGFEAAGSPDVPLLFLISPETTDNVISIAVALFAAAILGVLSAFNNKLEILRRVAGWATVLIAAVFVAQVQRQLSQFGGGPGSPSLISMIGIGVYLTTVGGLVMALAPKAKA